MPFLMSIRGGWNFSKSSEIQKVLNYPRGGGGVGLIGTFPQIFPFFLVTPPLTDIVVSAAVRLGLVMFINFREEKFNSFVLSDQNGPNCYSNLDVKYLG